MREGPFETAAQHAQTRWSAFHTGLPAYVRLYYKENSASGFVITIPGYIFSSTFVFSKFLRQKSPLGSTRRLFKKIFIDTTSLSPCP